LRPPTEAAYCGASVPTSPGDASGTASPLILAALIYNFTVHRKVATMEKPSPALSKSVAVVSLLLWVLIVFGGIFTGFLE